MHFIGRLCMCTKLKLNKKKKVLPALFPLLPLFYSVLSYRCWIFPFEDVNAVCFWAVVVIHNQHNIVCTVIDIFDGLCEKRSLLFCDKICCVKPRLYRLLCKLENIREKMNTVLIFVVGRQLYHMFNTKFI